MSNKKYRSRQEIESLRNSTPPKCGNSTCSNPCYFTKKLYWSEYCSKECRLYCNYHDKAVITNLSKYGVDNPMKLGSVRAKFTNTMKEKYGVEHAMQSESISFKHSSNFSKVHSVDNPMKLGSVRAKFTNTMKEKYGVEHAMQSESIKRTVDRSSWKCSKAIAANKLKFKNRIGDKSYHILDDIDTLIALNKSHSIPEMAMTLGVSINLLYKIFKKNNKGIKKHYNSSTLESQILNFLTLNNINPLRNSRSIITPKELDFVINSKVAIEANGLLWHSGDTGRKDMTYHMDKVDDCYKKGIRLIHVWQHDWIYRRSGICGLIMKHISPLTNYDEKSISYMPLSVVIINEFVSEHAYTSLDTTLPYNGVIFGGVLIGIFSNERVVEHKNYYNPRLINQLMLDWGIQPKLLLDYSEHTLYDISNTETVRIAPQLHTFNNYTDVSIGGTGKHHFYDSGYIQCSTASIT